MRPTASEVLEFRHDKFHVGKVTRGRTLEIASTVASTDGRMPVHAVVLAACRKTPIINTNQLSHQCRLLTLRRMPCPCAFAHIFAQPRPSRSLLSPPIASHSHACRLLQALQMCVLDLLPTQAILMPVCWLRLFHTLLWNERRRRCSPPVAPVPDSSHGFKVRPVSERLTLRNRAHTVFHL